ncbi:MAG: hypothetical protein K9K64_03460 [Desulfohalobiaceae bacterium]|nr:hypothetical protein [Desulfohalobiaceae bacterium]
MTGASKSTGPAFPVQLRPGSIVWIGLLLVFILPAFGAGRKAEGAERASGLTDTISGEWSGHLRTSAVLSRAESGSHFNPVGSSSTLVDGSSELRLKNTLYFGRDQKLTTHYLVNAFYGDMLEQSQGRHRPPSALDMDGLLPGFAEEDRTSLFDLSQTFYGQDDVLARHRLDRLKFSLFKDWGTLNLGRQALTWGNGIVFHPFDLFNPFSPSAIIKDYKTGQDMAALLLPLGNAAELDVLYVPRRNRQTRNLSWNESSLAGKFHFFAADCEFDILVADHFQDLVFGFGARGSLESAAWRLDATWTDPEQSSGYLSLVANIDRSWVWMEKNFYGFLEAYYHGLGVEEPETVLAEPELIARIERGELFVLSRAYLALGMEVELHPLLMAGTNLILNIGDGSGLLQPKLTWDPTADLEVIVGANLYFGDSGSEFGGFDLATSSGVVRFQEPNAAFAWLTWYF